jgi:hypothetical protein
MCIDSSKYSTEKLLYHTMTETDRSFLYSATHQMAPQQSEDDGPAKQNFDLIMKKGYPLI